MTDIPDWVLLEAAKRGGWPYDATASDGGLAELRMDYDSTPRNAFVGSFAALCDMIAKYEKQPADRKLLIAWQAAVESAEPEYQSDADMRRAWLNGEYDDDHEVRSAVRAIELWEESQ